MSPNAVILLVVIAACYAYSKGRARGQSENIAKAIARFFENK
ncbi:hypothetical protein [Streptomyces longisporoflavus]|uniref:Uncharacterized protein n=1 Tax=Streptomyces longisporoflavus TaxID=28044 RepID=A0ABW7R305_9ACTN